MTATAPARDLRACPHTPPCPGADDVDAAAARIVSEHLQDCGYALLCNGRLLLEGDGLLPLVTPAPFSPGAPPRAPQAA